MNIFDEVLTTQQSILARLSAIEVLLKRQESAQKTTPLMASSNGKTSHNYDLLTIPEFAKRIKRCTGAVYKSIQRGRMPQDSVVYIHGGVMRINWTRYAEAIIRRPS